jgi:hypothetical protein
MGKHWTLRRVVTHTQKTGIDAWIFKNHGYKPGNPAYLGMYQKTVTEIVDGLDHDEKKRVQAIADRWNQNGPPPDVKKLYVLTSKVAHLLTSLNRLAKKHAAKLLVNFAKIMKTHCDMELMIFSAWVSMDANDVNKVHTNR